MPSPISNRTAVDASTSDLPESSPPSPEPATTGLAPSQDSVTEWSPRAEQAYEHIDDAHGWGLAPDNEAISAELNHLNGFDLKQVLGRLQGDGKLGEIISDLSPMQREGLLGQSMEAGLVKRNGGPNGKLAANTDVPATFKRMVDDFNAMGPGRTAPLNYKWDLEPDTLEKLHNKVTSAVVDLKPGDSVALGAGSEADVEGAKVSEGLGLEVRNDAGKYVMSLNASAGAGFEYDENNVRAESMIKAGARSEYTFPDADSAAAVAYGLLKDRGLSAAALRSPSAIELNGSVAAQVAGKLAMSGLSVGEAAAEGKAELTARFVLDQNPPRLEVKQTLSLGESLAAGADAVGKHDRFAANAAGGLKTEHKLEVTTSFELPKNSAADVAKDPLSAVAQHAAEILATGQTRVAVKVEDKGLGELHEVEASAQVKQTDVARFAKDVFTTGATAAFARLGEKTEVEVAEKDYRVSGGGIGGVVEKHGLGAGLSLGLERKSLLREHKIFEGSATELLLGKPRSH